MAVLDWSPLTEADLPALMALAQDCLDADGGLPQLATGPYLRELFLTDVGIAGRDDTTELLAAAALGHRGDRRTATGRLVHPSARRQGHGEHLVDWCQAQAGGGSPLVIAETMSIEAESLFRRKRIPSGFAESVMRHKLKAVPRPRGASARRRHYPSLRSRDRVGLLHRLLREFRRPTGIPAGARAGVAGRAARRPDLPAARLARGPRRGG